MGTSVELDASDLHRMSLATFHRLVDGGGFDEDTHIEVINGLLLDLPRKTPEHERVVSLLAEWLSRHVDSAAIQVRVHAPLTVVAAEAEPEPDIAAIRRGTPSPYHPASAALVVEVAVNSQRRDLVLKPPVYAAAGVDEYWVVDLLGARVVCHRSPACDGYAERRVLLLAESLTATALSLPELVVGDLLASPGY